MKKILTKLLLGVLALCLLLGTLSACSESNWSGSVTLKTPGNVVSNGGFISETENYLYFINGVGSSTADNTMGTPLKGSLMVVDKNDLTKPQTVVPKLFVASDYNAGVFIDGGYVYYGTPSTEKNAEGNIANDELTFVKTKLDGSGNTTEFFTVDSLSIEYRIVKGDNGNVYIVYYDANNSAIVSYNTANGSKETVAKTDSKADETLSTYKFIDGEDGFSVIYVNTVYAEPYSADKAASASYSRPTETFNKMYAYKVGEGSTLLYSGAYEEGDLDDATYAATLIKNGYLFYTETIRGVANTYALDLSSVAEATTVAKGTKIANTTYVADSTVIESLNEVYVLENGTVYKTTLVEKDNEIKRPVAKASTISTLLFVKGTDLYYYNSSNQIARIELKNLTDGADLNKEVNEIRVSEDSVSTTWYDPEVITIDGKEVLFYCDNSNTGKSYIKYVDLGATVIEEDTDDDDKNDLFYVDTESVKLLGVMTVADQASVVTSKINALSNLLPSGGLTATDDDKEFMDKVAEIKALYDGITNSEVKSAVSEDAVKTLNRYIKAEEIAKLYVKLEGIQDVLDKDDIPANLQTAYDEVKGGLEAFKSSNDAAVVDNLIHNNLKYYYQQYLKLLEAKD